MGKKTEYLPCVKNAAIPQTHKKALFVLNVFRESNLSIMEFGMKKILSRHGIKVEELPPGVGVLFVNHDRTYVKMLIGNGTDYPVIAAKRLPAKHRLPTEAMTEIAKAFGKNDGVEATKKLSNSIDRYFEKKAKPVGVPALEKGVNESR